jgi:hypothetical protein
VADAILAQEKRFRTASGFQNPIMDHGIGEFDQLLPDADYLLSKRF